MRNITNLEYKGVDPITNIVTADITYRVANNKKVIKALEKEYGDKIQDCFLSYTDSPLTKPSAFIFIKVEQELQMDEYLKIEKEINFQKN